MEKEEREEEESKRREGQAKAEYVKRKTEDALKRGAESGPIEEDSEVVDKMFGFLDPQDIDKSRR